MLDQLTHATFSQQLNTSFQFQIAPEHLVAMELVETGDVRSSGQYEAFSIVLRGPSDIPLRQGMYRVDHDTIGAFDLFIVPISQESDGLYYEACFNRLRSEEPR